MAEKPLCISCGKPRSEHEGAMVDVCPGRRAPRTFWAPRDPPRDPPIAQPNNRPNRTLARRIANGLFTFGEHDGIKADALHLMRDGEYLGGWGEAPCAAFIERILDQAAADDREAKNG